MNDELKVSLNLTAIALRNDVEKIDYKEITIGDLRIISEALENMLHSFNILQEKTTRAMERLDN